MTAIHAEQLTKVYGGTLTRKAPSLANLTLQIERNEIFGFLGRNGAGKTTTIKLFCSLIKPTSGQGYIFGQSIYDRTARRFLGYLPEQPYFYEYLTPRETLDFYGRLQGLSAKERAHEWDRLSELLDLRDIADQHIRGFSKGMRQRVGFAVALVGDPPLLILDEPMSGLDPVGRRQIRELILRLKEQGKTVFFSSHVLSDVEQICDRVGILAKGTLIRTGSLEELVGMKVEIVEVVAAGVPEAIREQLTGTARSVQHQGETTAFSFDSVASANTALKALTQSGGTILSVTPLRETLEDYFMKELERALGKPVGAAEENE